MHVLVIPSWFGNSLDPNKGGFFRDHAISLVELGHTVGIAHCDDRTLRSLSPKAIAESHFQYTEATDRGITILTRHGWNPNSQSVLGAKLWAKFAERTVLEYIKRHGRPDVVHAQSGRWASVAAARVKARLGIPFLVTEHNSRIIDQPKEPGLNEIYTKAMKEAAVVSAVSSFLGSAVSKATGIPEVRVIPNCIDYDFWAGIESTASASVMKFVGVGYLIPLKGHATLLRAFHIVKNSAPDATLTIVGAGDQLSELVSLSDSLGVRDHVSFPGSLAREQLRCELATSACYVCSSEVETFGVAPLEALAVGIPVVSTACGGPSDYVESPSGRIVPVGDAESMAEAMLSQASADRSETRKNAQGVAGRYRREVVAISLEAALVEASKRTTAPGQPQGQH